jgi:hypothetical protein
MSVRPAVEANAAPVPTAHLPRKGPLLGNNAVVPNGGSAGPLAQSTAAAHSRGPDRPVRNGFPERDRHTIDRVDPKMHACHCMLLQTNDSF